MFEMPRVEEGAASRVFGAVRRAVAASGSREEDRVAVREADSRSFGSRKGVRVTAVRAAVSAGVRTVGFWRAGRVRTAGSLAVRLAGAPISTGRVRVGSAGVMTVGLWRAGKVRTAGALAVRLAGGAPISTGRVRSGAAGVCTSGRSTVGTVRVTGVTVRMDGSRTGSGVRITARVVAAGRWTSGVVRITSAGRDEAVSRCTRKAGSALPEETDGLV